MKNTDSGYNISRRGFLRQSACAALGYTGLVNSLAHLTLVNNAVAQTSLTGYKALVVVFLNGGNDSNNMLIPRMGHPQYNNYKVARDFLRIMDQNDPARPASEPYSIPLTTPDGTYGIHPSMQPVADLFHAGELSFVANVGTLCFPILTQQDYITGAVPLPPERFSHSSQQVQWQSSLPDQEFSTGWGGRIADLLAPTTSSSGAVSMNIAINNLSSLQVGNDVIQYVIGSGGALTLEGYGTNYGSAWDGTNYTNTTKGKRFKAFEDVMRYTHEHLLEASYNDVMRRSRANEVNVGAAMTAAAGTGVNFGTLFNQNLGLARQLQMIAQLIAGRSALGNTRQIFFCSISGYDTHSGQVAAHANLMNELASSLKSFRDALVQLGVYDNVLTLTESDFARTLTPNTTGSDHAWGGHHMVMGGPVNGGRIFGHFPNLTLNSGRDTNTGNGRGRWIPTTSVEQYTAAAARWFGVDSGNLATIFPNLHRFDDPFGASANLNYLTL